MTSSVKGLIPYSPVITVGDMGFHFWQEVSKFVRCFIYTPAILDLIYKCNKHKPGTTQVLVLPARSEHMT